MTPEPLSSSWRYDLSSRKIFELRASLGLSGDGPAPPSSVFAYAIVPGLARILTHPSLASHRGDLRLSRLEVVFASELDMRGELQCSIEIDVGRCVVGAIASSDPRGARAIATVHLTTDDDFEPRSPLAGANDLERVSMDQARSIAFSAATWDLNPAYWDEDFAVKADLGGLVVPPGLPLALALESIRKRSGRGVASYDVVFERAARPGDEIAIGVEGSGDLVSFEACSIDGIVVAGEVGLRRESDGGL